MWLRDCVQSHLRCNSHTDGTSWYPTRLLHLAETDGKEGYVRLIRTAGTSPNEHYATLSHRWGNTRPLRLTRLAASDPNHRFFVAGMPRTFQEAIQVSKRLGIQYLWIDSLCIIQEGDNLRDWYHEAGLMGKVYMHSYLNIAAADADDGTKGLFRHHPSLLLGRQRVAVNTKELGSGPGYTDYLMTDLMLWSRNLGRAPLHNRGWVFQERFLAPRNLHFFRDQIFLECNERTVCETFPKGLPSNIMNLTTVSVKHGDEWKKLWYGDVVSQYSAMDLSVSTDKLIALSGIAKFFMARLEDKYVAVYRSPTWSWASVDGHVRPNLHWEDRELLIHVEDVVLSHATEDTTGAVTGGWLDLCGFLKPQSYHPTA
ncbi:heterokaryon incompatibility protein-domain-containing protein [Bipolaris maydis]|nr:heterokaryon incompatibility protein-domain-containing protein [Bipolaris maydis]